MNNLSIENLQKTIQSDQLKEMGVGSEFKASEELKASGMTPTDEQFGKKGLSFGDILKDSVQQVNQNQSESDHAIKELIAGRSKNIHETLLTVERADASLKMAMQVRNKILEAYREVMRMQV